MDKILILILFRLLLCATNQMEEGHQKEDTTVCQNFSNHELIQVPEKFEPPMGLSIKGKIWDLRHSSFSVDLFYGGNMASISSRASRTFFSEEGKIQKIRNDNPFPRYQNVDLCLLSTSDSSFKIHINGTLYDTFTLSQANNEDVRKFSFITKGPFKAQQYCYGRSVECR